jgi:hypothetical protein
MERPFEAAVVKSQAMDGRSGVEEPNEIVLDECLGRQRSGMIAQLMMAAAAR